MIVTFKSKASGDLIYFKDAALRLLDLMGRAVHHLGPLGSGAMGEVYEAELQDYDRSIEAYTDVLTFDPQETRALDALGREHGFAVVTFLKMGCPLSVNTMPMLGPNEYPDCLDWTRTVLSDIADMQPDYVFTTATRPREDAPGDFTPPWYASVWQQLTADGVGILGIRDTPWLAYRAIDCLADGGTAATTAASGRYIRCSTARSLKGTRLEVGARVRKNQRVPARSHSFRVRQEK